MHRQVGAILMLLGAGAVVVGGLVWLGVFNWFGKLPGDIRHEGRNARVFVPIVSSIVASVVLTVVVNVLLRLFR